MVPEDIDIVIRTMTVSAALLLGGLLLVKRRQNPAALPGALFAFAVAAFFITSARGSAAVLGSSALPLTALCVTKSLWFWLFARSLFNDDSPIDHRHLAIAAAVAVAGTWQQLVFLPEFRAGTTNLWTSIVGIGFDIVLFAFVLSGLYEAWRELDADLVEPRRRLRLRFMIVAGTYLSGTLAVQGYNLLVGASTPMLATWANMTFVTAACLSASGFLLKLRAETWVDPIPAGSGIALNRTEAAVLAQLERVLASERIYLQHNLTIGNLAAHLGTGEHVLRRVINHGMGHRNFNDFLHTWRIREACDELTQPEQARQPVLSIAMKVGYGSIGAFNRAFKQRVGMTPTDYRRQSLGRL